MPGVDPGVNARLTPLSEPAPTPTGPRRRLLALVAFQAGDAAFNVVARDWVRDDLDRLRVPSELARVLTAVKALSAAGLLTGLRSPRLGRITAVAITGYFVAAIGCHERVRDSGLRTAPAAAMLAWSVLAQRDFRALAGTPR
jgi:hypothetical protein